MAGSSLLSVALLGTAFLLPACSSVVVDPGEGGGGAGGSGTDVATTGTGKATSTGTVCAGFEDQAGSGAVTIHVVNDGPQEIFLPSLCTSADYTIVGADQQTWSNRANCSLSCEELQSQPPIYCGACPATVVRVLPYSFVDLTWSGTSFVSHAMPAECFFESPGVTTCGIDVAAPAQRYQAVLSAYSRCDDGTGSCVCDANGNCQGEVAGQVAAPLPAFFDYPAQDRVDVVFEACVFGCPEPAPGG